MRMHFAVAGFILLCAGEFLGRARAEPAAQALFSAPSLPDNPCDVLTVAELTTVTGLEVTSVRRLPSIRKIVRAQHEGREPNPGIICSYETGSDFGAIMIAVPARADRRSAVYWEARSKYFEAFPRSAQPIEGLGMDAWLAGGVALFVLLRENEHLTLSTQRYQRRSREILVHLAQAILRKR